jgi:SAM-dependent methyltransferase
MSNEQNYTFGDSALAAQRLQWLAEVFAPASERLLGELPAVHGGALDLGCGPGHTTRLVHERTAPTWTIGIDRSARMLELARANAPTLAFIEHEVTVVPFPVPAAALIYARFLTTHLHGPVERLRDWATLLAPGGSIVLEETAFMRSEHPAFQEYYANVQTLQAHYGQNMLIGERLAALCEQAGYVVIDSGVRPRDLPASQMARLHAANLPTWSQDPFARAAFDPERLRALGDTLSKIAAGQVEAPPVAVGTGHVVAMLRA